MVPAETPPYNIDHSGDMKKNTEIEADLIDEDFEAILQWSQTTFESSVS